MQNSKLRLKILESIKDGKTTLSLKVVNNIDFLHAFINMTMLINHILVTNFKSGSGVYRVKTANYEFNVYCNMEPGYDGYTSN